jgi:hypothetical protein
LGSCAKNGNNANSVATFSPTLRQRRYVGLRIKPTEKPQRGCGRWRRDENEMAATALRLGIIGGR